MSKTELTLQLEKEIYNATAKQGTFGCFEVTVGWYGKERVDYLTYDTKGAWRCYEIKSSVSDFKSKAAITFIGNYNYYVMPQEVYNAVKNKIPSGIGVIINGQSVIKAKRNKVLGTDEQTLKDSLIRSLSREYRNTRLSESRDYLIQLKREIEEQKRETQQYREKYYKIGNILRESKIRFRE